MTDGRKKGSAHRALPLLLQINCRCNGRKASNALCSRLGKFIAVVSVYQRDVITGAPPLYPGYALVYIIDVRFFYCI